MTSKEINNFEARRHDTLPKEGENVCDPSLCLNSGIVLITVTSYHITCINCHKNNFPCDISGCQSGAPRNFTNIETAYSRSPETQKLFSFVQAKESIFALN